jgi:hypothetical protein
MSAQRARHASRLGGSNSTTQPTPPSLYAKKHHRETRVVLLSVFARRSIKEGEGEMAENPQLFGNGMPVPFYGEMFVLVRDGVEFHVDKIPS